MSIDRYMVPLFSSAYAIWKLLIFTFSQSLFSIFYNLYILIFVLFFVICQVLEPDVLLRSF